MSSTGRDEIDRAREEEEIDRGDRAHGGVEHGRDEIDRAREEIDRGDRAREEIDRAHGGDRTREGDRAHVVDRPSRLERIARLVDVKRALVTMGYTRTEARAAVELTNARARAGATLDEFLVDALSACAKPRG